jgi:hypothetical protein
MSLSFESLVGQEIVPFIDRLAELRIAVFREFPYLYDGCMEYERKYLQTLSASPHSYLVLAREQERIVGASTALPLCDAEPAFRTPFVEHGLEPERFYYFGESILLPEHRGQGAGRVFFDEREAQADFLAFPQTCFCAVIRPRDHPAKPAGYRSLEKFWKRRGYRPVPELISDYPWRDLGDAEETAKPMQFWIRTL